MARPMARYADAAAASARQTRAVLSRTTSSVGSVRCSAGSAVPSRAARIAAVSVPAAARPLAAMSWRTVVRAGRRRAASGLSSKPMTETSLGHREAQVLGGADHAVGQDVGVAEHARGPVGTGEESGRGDPGLLVAVVHLPVHHGLDPGGAERVEVAEHPLAGHPLPPGQVSGRVVDQAVLAAEPGDHDRDPAVAQVDQVLRGGPGTAAVVDVDRGDPVRGLLVDEDQGQPAAGQPVGRRRVGVARVDQGPVERDVAGRDEAVATARGEQREREPGRRELLGDGGEEAHGDVVGEGVRQRRGEQDAHRAGGAAREGPGGRVGPDVPELPGGVQDPLPQPVGELVGPRERVGHGHPADADVVGDGLQGHSCHTAMVVLAQQAEQRSAGVIESATRCRAEASSERLRGARAGDRDAALGALDGVAGVGAHQAASDGHVGRGDGEGNGVHEVLQGEWIGCFCTDTVRRSSVPVKCRLELGRPGLHASGPGPRHRGHLLLRRRRVVRVPTPHLVAVRRSGRRAGWRSSARVEGAPLARTDALHGHRRRGSSAALAIHDDRRPR